MLELEKLLLNIRGISEAYAIDSCRKEINELYLREEILWKQCAKTSWLKKGNRNTKFFMVLPLEEEETIRLPESKMEIAFGMKLKMMLKMSS